MIDKYEFKFINESNFHYIKNMNHSEIISIIRERLKNLNITQTMLAELAGSGMLKIIAQWKEAGFIEPVIENNSPRGWFSLNLPFEETTQEAILRLIKEKPTITRKELAVKCGISPDGIKYHLDKLRNSGIIRHVGPPKGGHYEVLKDYK